MLPPFLLTQASRFPTTRTRSTAQIKSGGGKVEAIASANLVVLLLEVAEMEGKLH